MVIDVRTGPVEVLVLDNRHPLTSANTRSITSVRTRSLAPS